MEYHRPDYVFLLSAGSYGKDKPSLAVMDIQDKNWRSLGDHVKNIEYVELVEIEDAWHKTTMMEVYEKMGQIMKKSQKMAGKAECTFYAGLADAPALMSVGVAFSAVMYGMKTYFTRGRRPYYNREYVLDVDNLNEITSINNWLGSHYTKKRNLRYLREVIRLEDDGVNEIFCETIADNLPFTIEAVRNALRLLESKNLIHREGDRNMIISSTTLGRLAIKMNPDNGDDVSLGSDSIL